MLHARKEVDHAPRAVYSYLIEIEDSPASDLDKILKVQDSVTWEMDLKLFVVLAPPREEDLLADGGVQ